MQQSIRIPNKVIRLMKRTNLESLEELLQYAAENPYAIKRCLAWKEDEEKSFKKRINVEARI